MTEERIQLLESIGFKWAKASGQELWEEYYNKLVVFQAQVWPRLLLFTNIRYFIGNSVILILSAFAVAVRRMDTVMSPPGPTRMTTPVRSSMRCFFSYWVITS